MKLNLIRRIPDHISMQRFRRLQMPLAMVCLGFIGTGGYPAIDLPTAHANEAASDRLTNSPSANNAKKLAERSQTASGGNRQLESAVHREKQAKPTPVPAQEALEWLKSGNQRFVQNRALHMGRSTADRDRLSLGQSPHSIILSCADSRVPPEIVFDQGLGDLFVVRSAGQALDSAVIASLEYAVDHLGARLLVVMGHSSCGAVSATLDQLAQQSPSGHGSPHIEKLIADIAPRLKGTQPKLRSPNLKVETTQNAQRVVHDLVLRSEVIKKRIEQGRLTIVSAVYDLSNGSVDWNR